MRDKYEAMLGRPQGVAQNSGGPRSRSRNEKIRSTLLGHEEGPIVCPRRTSFCINFPRSCQDPVAYVEAILHAKGFASPEQLRGVFPIPPSPCVVSIWTHAPLPVHDEEILHSALVLGLCTATFYDPGRPVIWTHASLMRRLAFYDTEGFYALD